MKYNVSVIAVCVCGHTPVGADIVSAPSFIWPITPVIGQKLTIAKELVIPPNQLVMRCSCLLGSTVYLALFIT